MKMLELKNVSFDVHEEGEEKEILRNVSLTVPNDALTVITGPNGGGKSTLARLIAGIETPTEGQILLDGEDITGLCIFLVLHHRTVVNILDRQRQHHGNGQQCVEVIRNRPDEQRQA